NKKFVEEKGYEPFQTDNIPNKRNVIVTCMDTRLDDLLPNALGIHNCDVKMIKNAGAIIREPLDTTMKSILVSVYDLQAEEVLVIGHHDCGMSHVDTDSLKDNMKEKGISTETLTALENGGIDLHKEFQGFHSVDEEVENSVQVVRQHPLLPEYVNVHGMVIDQIGR